MVVSTWYVVTSGRDGIKRNASSAFAISVQAYWKLLRKDIVPASV